jgi:hypothetical protein
MPPADSPLVEKRNAAREVVDILDEIATLLVRAANGFPTSEVNTNMGRTRTSTGTR